MTEVMNLDYLCAKYGQEIPDEEKLDEEKPKDYENLIQKSLGVLQEDGLFAFVVYLESVKQKDKQISKKIRKRSLNLLREIDLIGSSDLNNLREEVLKLTSRNLDDIFLAKGLIEKMLIYARYRAKALSD